MIERKNLIKKLYNTAYNSHIYEKQGILKNKLDEFKEKLINNYGINMNKINEKLNNAEEIVSCFQKKDILKNLRERIKFNNEENNNNGKNSFGEISENDLKIWKHNLKIYLQDNKFNCLSEKIEKIENLESSLEIIFELFKILFENKQENQIEINFGGIKNIKQKKMKKKKIIFNQ